MKTLYSKNSSDYYISKEKTLKDLKLFLKNKNGIFNFQFNE